MSETTRGILNMPKELWMNNEMAAIQVESAMKSASKELDTLRDKAAAFDWQDENYGCYRFEYLKDGSAWLHLNGTVIKGESRLDCINQAMKDNSE